MLGAEVLHLHYNFPDSLDLPAFLLGIPRACRVENTLIGKSLEIPSPTVSVAIWSSEVTDQPETSFFLEVRVYLAIVPALFWPKCS